MSKNITATIGDNYEAEKKRFTLPDNGISFQRKEGQWATGVSIQNVYIGRRWFIVEFYSIWENKKTGGCIGSFCIAYDMDCKYYHNNILEFCESLSIAIPSKIEETAEEI